MDNCTAVLELEEHCPSFPSFVASAVEDTEDSAGQLQNFAHQRACTVTVEVAVGIVRKVRGSQVVVHRYKSSLQLQERWGQQSRVWDKAQQVVEKPEGCSRQ